jgi:transcriptional regulator with XRE-family HTH domain
MSIRKKSKTIKKLEKIAGEELTISSLIRSTRLGMELSQEKFGELLGVGRAYICDIEKGRTVVSVEQAVVFAKKLGKSEIVFVKLSLDEQCRRIGLNYHVELKAS